MLLGTVYKFFSNKEALYRALMTEKLDEYLQEWDSAVDWTADEINIIRESVKAVNRNQTCRAGAACSANASGGGGEKQRPGRHFLL